MQVGAGIMDIMVFFLVFENGCKPLVTSVQVGAGIMDIVFVMCFCCSQMFVNSCAHGDGHVTHMWSCY